VPVGREQDREMRRDDQQLVEEIRRLFERYRETARHATVTPEQHRRAEAPEKAPVLTPR
jgi:hypothetical protein